MLRLSLARKTDPVLKVLCLGAHSDDIEVGCGGTILKLVERYPDNEFYWVVLSANRQRAQEATESASAFLRKARDRNIVIKGFRDGFFPYIGSEIKECFERLKEEFSPHLVFTHYRRDLHQDHRLVSSLTWNTFRDHLILEYEIPKYDGDLGCPNLFVHLDEATCRRKVEYILDGFKSQAENQWFSKDAFLAILRLRGIESNAPDKYAEAFYCRKMVF
jgi:LmbE family N-acetylglucosaminyl deacetylase